jgi:hypothetical protein
MSLFDQDQDTIDEYWERATNNLVESAWLPLSDDVWATDKYDDTIAEKAEALWEKDQEAKVAK